MSWRLLLLAAPWLLGGPAPLRAAPAIALHYAERPPYLMEANGHLTGLTGAPAVAAFKASGVAFTLHATPTSRQLVLIKANTGLDCGIGWFKNEEREGFGKFTKPIYQDQAQVAVTAAGSGKIKEGEALEALLANQDVVLLVKQGFSYGKALDAAIASFHPVQRSAAADNDRLLQMIIAGRADYMFMAPEEVDGLAAADKLNPAEISKVRLANAPQGEQRYILCSKQVPDEAIARINKAIDRLGEKANARKPTGKTPARAASAHR